MASATMKNHKRRARRRIAAINFLSNISLDGSYRDTKYAIFNRKHHRLKDGINEEGEQLSNKLCTDSEKKDTENHDSSEDGTKNLSANTAANSVENVTKKFGHKKENLHHGSNTPTKRASVSISAEEKERARVKAVQEKADKLHKGSSTIVTGDTLTGSSVRKNLKVQSPKSSSKLKNERLVIVTERKSPMVVCSTLAYSRRSQFGKLEEEPVHTRIRHLSATKSFNSQEGLLYFGLHAVSKVEDGQDISYSEFLIPSKQSGMKRVASDRGALNAMLESSHYAHGGANQKLLRSQSYDPTTLLHKPALVPALEKVPETAVATYNATILDDPELQSGSYRTLLTFPSYMTSVMEYVKPSTLKKELNEKFRERFPNIQLTLTKLRSLKRELKRIAYTKCGLDLWLIAQAYVYYEKLILKLMINKQNRKLCAGACLILSAKLSDIKGEQLTKLIQLVEDEFRLSRKELLMFEFACLVGLEFSLHIPDSEVFPHYQRLLYQS